MLPPAGRSNPSGFSPLALNNNSSSHKLNCADNLPPIFLRLEMTLKDISNNKEKFRVTVE